MYVFIFGNLTPSSLSIKSLLYWSGTTTGLQEKKIIEKQWMVWTQESFQKQVEYDHPGKCDPEQDCCWQRWAF